MYFLVCLLILVIIIKISNVKESFTGVCVPIFDPYINTRLRKTDIKDLYDRKMVKTKVVNLRVLLKVESNMIKKITTQKLDIFKNLILILKELMTMRILRIIMIPRHYLTHLNILTYLFIFLEYILSLFH